VWALIDLLLLTRAYSSGNLFAKAMGKNSASGYVANKVVNTRGAKPKPKTETE